MGKDAKNTHKTENILLSQVTRQEYCHNTSRVQVTNKKLSRKRDRQLSTGEIQIDNKYLKSCLCSNMKITFRHRNFFPIKLVGKKL